MTPEHAMWMGFGACLIGATVRFLKASPLPGVPTTWLPWISLVLGALGGAATALQAGRGWETVLLTTGEGILSGALAIAGHETLVESLRGGKEFFAGDKESTEEKSDEKVI